MWRLGLIVVLAGCGAGEPRFALAPLWMEAADDGAVQGFREFQFSPELMEDYGYPEITDEVRRKIFGENLAGLLGIDTSKRRVKV